MTNFKETQSNESGIAQFCCDNFKQVDALHLLVVVFLSGASMRVVLSYIGH